MDDDEARQAADALAQDLDIRSPSRVGAKPADIRIWLEWWRSRSAALEAVPGPEREKLKAERKWPPVDYDGAPEVVLMAAGWGLKAMLLDPEGPRLPDDFLDGRGSDW